MEILLGAAHCIDPLGNGVEATVAAMRADRSGLSHDAAERVQVGRITVDVFDPKGPRALELAVACVHGCTGQLVREVIRDARTVVVLSTTKGEIEVLQEGDAPAASLPSFGVALQARLDLPWAPVIVSNACASGTSAIILAAGLIRSNAADHVLVIGVDVLSRFVISGFRALHAIASGPCRPYDRERDGIVLGEAAASVVVTRDRSLFDHPLGVYLGGAIANDANHISGPSRTGEGLVRAVESTLRQTGTKAADITTINAHGTGTDYNDAMESIAFDRSGLGQVPLNSFKGSFGHTLGAAGLLESIIALHALRDGRLLRCEGTREVGLPRAINVLLEHTTATGDTLLKTSSGFGGCNAAILLRAWNH